MSIPKLNKSIVKTSGFINKVNDGTIFALIPNVLGKKTIYTAPDGSIDGSIDGPIDGTQAPETILQFGTGVLLRGLQDWLVEAGNRAGCYNGKVLVVKTTAGTVSDFEAQDCLYSLQVDGIADGKLVNDTHLISSISRVVSALDSWHLVLDAIANGQINLIISNTTEVGIVYDATDRLNTDINIAPNSFPLKVLALLLHRYRTGIRHNVNLADTSVPVKGLVIIPCELVVDNGTLLSSIVTKLAAQHLAHEADYDTFMAWVTADCVFCNSLVDRIVPGKLNATQQAVLQAKIGVIDDLAVSAEPYALWAVEAKGSNAQKVHDVLGFSKASASQLIIAEDITPYRERKLRLLNGTHTIMVALAYLSGLNTVKEAMEDPEISAFITAVALQEIAPTVAVALGGSQFDTQNVATNASNALTDALAFGNAVLDRFRNPNIEHKLLGICLQYTSKMRARNVATINRYYKVNDTFPPLMTLGFGAYLAFSHPYAVDEVVSGVLSDAFKGHCSGRTYKLNDDASAKLAMHWLNQDTIFAVKAILADQTLWGQDLTLLPGFEDMVTMYVQNFQNGAFWHNNLLATALNTSINPSE